MPIFEYHCAKCRRVFEALVSLEKEGAVRCPRCGGCKIKKLFSTFAFGSSRIKSSGSSSGHSCGSCSSHSCSTCH